MRSRALFLCLAGLVTAQTAPLTLRLTAAPGTQVAYSLVTSTVQRLGSVQVLALPGVKLSAAAKRRRAKLERDMNARLKRAQASNKTVHLDLLVTSLPGQTVAIRISGASLPGPVRLEETLKPGGQSSLRLTGASDPRLGTVLNSLLAGSSQGMMLAPRLYGQPLNVGDAVQQVTRVDLGDFMGGFVKTLSAGLPDVSAGGSQLATTVTSTYQGQDAAGLAHFAETTTAGNAQFNLSLGPQIKMAFGISGAQGRGESVFRPDGLLAGQHSHREMDLAVAITLDPQLEVVVNLHQQTDDQITAR